MIDEFLKIVQKSFPLTERPFKEIGDKINLSEEETFNIYKKLKEDTIIRHTSIIIETRKVGYNSTLVAFNVDNIKEAAKIINTHPGVSNNMVYFSCTS